MADEAEQMAFEKVAILVVEGLGIGAQPDASADDDRGADTLGHVATYMGGLQLPFLQWMGLGNVHPVRGLGPADPPAASVGVLARASAGRDPVGGLRELLGGTLSPLREEGIDVRALGSICEHLDEEELNGAEAEADVPEDHLLHRMAGAMAGGGRAVVLGGLRVDERQGGPVATARRLAWLDGQLPTLLDHMDEGSLLLVVGLGGADPVLPTHPDPTREVGPMLAYTPAVPSGVALGERSGLGDVGATLSENFGLGGSSGGDSFFGPLLA